MKFTLAEDIMKMESKRHLWVLFTFYQGSRACEEKLPDEKKNGKIDLMDKWITLKKQGHDWLFVELEIRRCRV